MSADALVSYAALILADAEVEISSDKLIAITKAAGSPVEQVWADVFAKALAGKDLKEILFNIGASGPAAAAPAAAAAGSADAPAAEEAEEEKDESDDDMGFGLFD
ncbi:60S acidic ribosomal protein P1 [Yarrowia lipolytica]|uniref:YALI0B12804p n=2 Tax=Yarrowia lipolytica TaxID=4952 RepID=Q6CEU7_YARLI|nr:60S acidic ribosomal protein P1 [Yarrowia lipolytica CLIB122]KAB8281853.1 60S acidic ribosomal protein P1 [Yarrowia lipolytica]KAE8169805.1 60S acidic ribosomal protein P1 [Yarrowia lipolytica]KAJ8052427.1 60S acidic ribosomal protein P1 [Yarrowia lipolytica]QNP96730.1 60S acidic ribosomal protein P1-B [Yarrowia lipolytica]RDW26512.1 60S acidic ribosomal protein P1 [Yarrowia lipolytica]|eukprot:XP_500815.1 60S acidic ribosomal protein P1 [Yarrowia lipolytica CLIB122]